MCGPARQDSQHCAPRTVLGSCTMFQADVANRICRPNCERFFASLDQELGDAERQDRTTLRLCRALFTHADQIGATYHELFAGAAIALLEVAYNTGHGA